MKRGHTPSAMTSRKTSRQNAGRTPRRRQSRRAVSVPNPPGSADDRTALIAPAADPAEAVERVVSRRQLIVEPGDIVLARETVAHESSWQYRLHVHPEPSHGSLANVFARFDWAAAAGEDRAANSKVRLFYDEDGVLTLLQDYRPA